MFRSLILAALISAAVGQTELEPFITSGTGCIDVFAAPSISVATVCAEMVGENLEVALKMNEDVPCCISESHICNIPAIPFNAFLIQGLCVQRFTMGLSLELIYDFVCDGDVDATFLVAGHMSVECTVDMGTRRLKEETGAHRSLQVFQIDAGEVEAVPVTNLQGIVGTGGFPDDPFKFNGYYEIPLGCREPFF